MIQIQDVYKPLEGFVMSGIQVLTPKQYEERYGKPAPSDTSREFKNWADIRPEVVNSTRRSVVYDDALVLGEGGVPVLLADGTYALDMLAMPREQAISFNFSPDQFVGGAQPRNSLPVPLALPPGTSVVNAPGLAGSPVVRFNALYEQFMIEQKGGVSPQAVNALEARLKTISEALAALAASQAEVLAAIRSLAGR